jgi:gentisate 1,2-dioxygenase
MNAVVEPKEKIRAWSHELGLVGLWEIVREVEVKEPKKSFVPAAWRWKDIRPLLLAAARDIPLEESDRRVMILSNPGVFPRHHSTNTLYVSASIYNAGEKATVHRHTPNASRFVLEGTGGYTIIEGEKCTMSRGDLIITPNGTWHDHGNEGTEAVMWIDLLDLPLVEHLGASFFEFDFKENGAASQFQTVSAPVDHSVNLYGASGMRPTFLPHVRGRSQGSPMFVDGLVLEYVNPVTGEPVTTTMSFSVQLLKPGQALKRHRHTSSSFYCCLKGRGKTIVEGKELAWGENDLVVVPTWAWHEHVNLDPKNDAVLYCVSDEPVMKKLGLYREETLP